MQTCADLVELEKCCKTHISSQILVSIQPRTSPPKNLQNFATANARSLGVANFAAWSAADLLLLEEVRELRAERAELGLRRRGAVGLLAEPREVVLQRGLGGAAIDPWCGAAGKEESIPNFRFPFFLV